MIGDTINLKNDISLVNDLFAKFKETYFKQQDDQLNLIKTKSVISAFVATPFL